MSKGICYFYVYRSSRVIYYLPGNGWETLLWRRVIVTVIYILRKRRCNDRWFTQHFPGFLYRRLQKLEVSVVMPFLNKGVP